MFDSLTRKEITCILHNSTKYLRILWLLPFILASTLCNKFHIGYNPVTDKSKTEYQFCFVWTNFSSAMLDHSDNYHDAISGACILSHTVTLRAVKCPLTSFFILSSVCKIDLHHTMKNGYTLADFHLHL